MYKTKNIKVLNKITRIIFFLVVFGNILQKAFGKARENSSNSKGTTAHTAETKHRNIKAKIIILFLLS